MVTILVDGKPYEVSTDQHLLTALLSLGFNIPYFCWHPALHSVGACRLCAVKAFRDERDSRGHIIMSCMTPVSDGLRISTSDPEVLEFRASVIEWLMINHPHDCPVCDEGGECHLQDMTVMTGHNYRRYRYKKNTYLNQDLGPFVNHEMNRCIQCYRCVRFYRDYAGGRDLNVYGMHHNLYFGRFDSGILESEFSGNLVEICPTGVFTDKSLKRHYTRKWDLQTAPSVCVHCGVGCNIIPGERYGTLRRILNRYNSEVNGYFLCDRGRYGYDFVNSASRLRHILLKQGEAPSRQLSPEEAYDYLAGVLERSSGVIGIGSPRASLESNFALRSLVGPERFSAGLTAKDLDIAAMIVQVLSDGTARSASLHDVETSDAVLILGEDVSNTAPRLALSLRQSILQGTEKIARPRGIPRWNDRHFRALVPEARSPLFIATPVETRLDEIATETWRGAPAELARLGFAMAHEIDPSAPDVENLDADARELASRIARELAHAERPLVVSGTGCGTVELVSAASQIGLALHRKGHQSWISLVVPECNTIGVALIGGIALEAALEAVTSGRADTVIVVENDLFRRMPSQAAEELFGKVRHVTVIDHLRHASFQRADLSFPAATFAEGHGILINDEGRAQRFYQVMKPPEPIKESWRHLVQVIGRAGRPDMFQCENLDVLVAQICREIPVLQRIGQCAPPADFRVTGEKIPRQPHRYSGRTAMGAHTDVHEPCPPPDFDSPLAFSMEGYPGIPPAGLISRFWAPGWNSVQALNKFQSEVAGQLTGGDPGKRLIEPPETVRCGYAPEAPAQFVSRDGEWLIIPAHHVFGSEELSVLSPEIRQMTVEPYLGINPESASAMGLHSGSPARLEMENVSVVLPIRIVSELAQSLAVLPVGLPAMEYYDLPAWGTITAVQAGTQAER